MDPVWVLFWAMLVLYAGFFIGWLVPGRSAAKRERMMRIAAALPFKKLVILPRDTSRDTMFGFAALAGIAGVGLGCGVLLGNPWGAATAFVFALAAGLAWGASEWLPKRFRIPRNESWSQRLARWGFPSSEQMAMAAFREDLRGRLSLYTCTCRACSS
jgi:hypothetical protein